MSNPFAEQLSHTLERTQLPGLGPCVHGKVRDVYSQNSRVFLVATDRVSAFDRILTTIPFKGEVLNRLAHFWFQKTSHIAPNHLLDVPDPNVTVARKCEPFRVEVVVRAYLTGSLWRDYEKGTYAAYGIQLPKGIKKDEAFPIPLLTPSTKGAVGEHDLPLSEREILARNLASGREWQRIREAALALFAEGQRWAQSRGLILVDTKYEFGRHNGGIYVIDEIHTPDSSRFWEASEYAARFAEAREQKMLDKENLRQWLLNEKGFSGEGECPAIPDEVRVNMAEIYLKAYERIIGEPMQAQPGDVHSRIEQNLKSKGYL
jgi:phosphoribosylaminoimidazole-succinocarboxamide synthase